MSGKYIIAGLAASFAIAYGSDVLVAQKKVFGGKEGCPILMLPPQNIPAPVNICTEW